MAPNSTSTTFPTWTIKAIKAIKAITAIKATPNIRRSIVAKKAVISKTYTRTMSIPSPN